MQHRFSSPHPVGGHVQMQQQHQQMVQQQQQQPPGLIQLPNGLIVLPNGQMVTPQQAQALISSGGMQQMTNNMQMMPMNTGMPMGMPMQGGMTQTDFLHERGFDGNQEIPGVGLDRRG